MNLPSGSQRIFGSTKKTTNGKCHLLTKVQLSHSADNAKDIHVPWVYCNCLQHTVIHSRYPQIGVGLPTVSQQPWREHQAWYEELCCSCRHFPFYWYFQEDCVRVCINRCGTGVPLRSLWNIQYFSHYHESTYRWKPHLKAEFNLRACSDRRHEWCDHRWTALRRGVNSPKMQYLLFWAAGNYDHPADWTVNAP